MTDTDRTLEHLANLIDAMTDVIYSTHRRVLALQIFMERAELTSPEEVEAKMQALDDAATLEVEMAPEHEQFRQLRSIVRRAAEKAKEEREEPGGPESERDPS